MLIIVFICQAIGDIRKKPLNKNRDVARSSRLSLDHWTKPTQTSPAKKRYCMVGDSQLTRIWAFRNGKNLARVNVLRSVSGSLLISVQSCHFNSSLTGPVSATRMRPIIQKQIKPTKGKNKMNIKNIRSCRNARVCGAAERGTSKLNHQEAKQKTNTLKSGYAGETTFGIWCWPQQREEGDRGWIG